MFKFTSHNNNSLDKLSDEIKFFLLSKNPRS
ncbi:hypothetical protein CbuG_0960 [Coxiella burnetii CbuG_Q212]|nr:hypothetical protein CbuG_0960 [Coxiella burnetii CbuG_Q212]